MVILKWVSPKSLLKDGGLISTTIQSDQQWDSPNGWAPLHWFVIQGLIQYDHLDLADTIKKRWSNTIEQYYLKTGKIMEKSWKNHGKI